MGSFECACNEGYTGDGTTCTEVAAPDAGQVEADGGSPSDDATASAPDAGGEPDDGSVADAGGAAADLGADPDPTPSEEETSEGCGCESAGPSRAGAKSAIFLLLIGLAARRRKIPCATIA